MHAARGKGAARGLARVIAVQWRETTRTVYRRLRGSRRLRELDVYKFISGLDLRGPVDPVDVHTRVHVGQTMFTSARASVVAAFKALVWRSWRRVRRLGISEGELGF